MGTEDQRAFKRFKKEPKFLKKFKHPNIVGYVDEYSEMESGDSNQCFYVMEYLSGKSLYRHVQQHAIPGDPIKIAIGVASALVELHRKEVVHRDIHLGNIFLSNGSPKLIDFGCAVGGGITKPYLYYDGKLTGLAGKFHRAPEAINPTEAKSKSDIFSFGITFLELLNTTIPSPYERENRELWIDRNLNNLSRRQPRFEVLIRQMLHPDPSERPSSTEVLRELRQDRSILPWVILGGAAVATTAAILWSKKSEKKKKKLTSSKSTQPIKKRIGAVLLDIDNTIAHKTKLSETFIILPPGDSYISNRTLKLLDELNNHIPIVLVTGRRSTRYTEMKDVIPHRYAIFENGAVIFDSKHVKLKWEGNDEVRLKHLWEFERQLKAKGYKPYKEGRTASFRIDKKDVSTDSEQKLKRTGVKLVSNGPFWDFLLAEAGKENAASYVLSKLGTSFEEVTFVGDDLNDLELLKRVGFPMTISKSNKDVIKAVKEKGGYVSQKEGHDGIIDILEKITLHLISLKEQHLRQLGNGNLLADGD